MKIQGKGPLQGKETNLNTQRSQGIVGTEERKQVNTPHGQRQVDRIDISLRGKEIASIIASVNNLPDLREEKIQTLKEAVNSGTYRIDPIKVAEKMLSEI